MPTEQMLPFSQAVNAVMRRAHVGTGSVPVRVVAAVVLLIVVDVGLVVVIRFAQRLHRRIVQPKTILALEVHRNDDCQGNPRVSYTCGFHLCYSCSV